MRRLGEGISRLQAGEEVKVCASTNSLLLAGTTQGC